MEVTRQGVKMAVSFEHPEHIQEPMIARVTDYFLGKGENPCTIEEAIDSMRIMETFVG